MQRRSFIHLSAAGTLAVFSGVRCSPSMPDTDPKWLYPGSLSYTCDEATLREIGKAYATRLNDSEKKNLVKEILLSSGFQAGKDKSDSLSVRTMVDDQVKRDFETGKIVIVKGWVLSETEARQCVLYNQNHS